MKRRNKPDQTHARNDRRFFSHEFCVLLFVTYRDAVRVEFGIIQYFCRDNRIFAVAVLESQQFGKFFILLFYGIVHKKSDLKLRNFLFQDLVLPADIFEI